MSRYFILILIVLLVANKYVQAQSIDSMMAVRNEAGEYYKRGQVAFMKKQIEQSVTYFDSALEVMPNMHQAYHAKALSLLRMGRHEKALFNVKQALAYEDNFEYLNTRAMIHMELGEFNEAISYFGKVLNKEPYNPRARFNRGYMLQQGQAFEPAIEDYNVVVEQKDSIRAKPYLQASYFYRGVALADINEFEKAYKSLNRAIELKPEDLEAKYQRALVLVDLKREDEAIEALQKLIETEPQYVQAHYQLGILNGKIDQFDKAIENFSRVIELQPRNFTAYQMRGTAKAKMRNYEAALQDVYKASQLAPENPKILYFAGNLHIALNNKNEACRDFKKAAKLGSVQAERFVQQNCR